MIGRTSSRNKKATRKTKARKTAFNRAGRAYGYDLRKAWLVSSAAARRPASARNPAASGATIEADRVQMGSRTKAVDW